MTKFGMGVAITKAILEAVGTDFLLKTGDTMTGDLDLSAVNIDWADDMVLYAITASSLSLRNVAKTALRTLQCNLGAGTITYLTNSGLFSSRNVADCSVAFRAGVTEVARMSVNTLDFAISRAGDITFLAGKSLDAYANAGYVKIRRLSQSEQPTPEEGEILLWRDTDDDTTYLMYEDVDVGTRKVQLT